MEMTFRTSPNSALGVPTFDINSVDTVAKVPVGTIAKATDDSGLGDGTFIYLPGVASLAAGDAVVYDLLPSGASVTRTLSGTHLNTGQPVAIALVAIPALSYGWYQIGGVAVVNVAAGAAAGRAMLTTTAGNLKDTAIAGCQVLGARLSSAIGTPSAGKAYCTLNHPHVQGQIT